MFLRKAISKLRSDVFTISLFLIATASVVSAQGANATRVLGRISTAFAGGQFVHRAQLSGNAIWYIGETQDSGSAKLTASADGSFEMQLSLSSGGQRTETKTVGSSTNCQWTGPDGVAQNEDLRNCLKPMVWFLPSISLQPAALSRELSVVDLGEGTVGSSEARYHHLQSQLSMVSYPNKIASELVQLSTTDLGLEPISELPAVLAYTIHPSNTALQPITVEVYYSDYHAVNGVQIPFLIQRYYNGALQLEIHIDSAKIN